MKKLSRLASQEWFLNRTRLGIVGALLLCCGGIAQAAYMVHDFYLPLPEDQAHKSFKSVAGRWSSYVGSTLESITSIVVTGPDTVIHYDHWEDGYEIDINNPAQATTQIWGDGDDSNGITPGFTRDPDGLPIGTVISLRNDVSLPRNPSRILYDARDRVTASKAIVVTRALWPKNPGPVLAEAIEVQATIDHGTRYIAPIGQDTDTRSEMFEYAGMAIMADENNTRVTITNPGASSQTITLNRGESHYIDGGIRAGAEVVATKPVQVHLLTGDVNANYETRWFTLTPYEDWYSAYISPVGTADNGHETYMFLYNPNNSPITINYKDRNGNGTFTVAAGESYKWLIPRSSGARVTSAGGEKFFAITTVGAKPSANDAHDWGFSLIPEDGLTTVAVVGWGPGSSDGRQNGSPVWVSAVRPTRIYVDFAGDGKGPLTDPNGNKYDVHYDLAELQSKTIFDPSRDLTAMRVYTLDGTLFATAWGQDPATASPGNPFLDMGTTVLPLPEPIIKKTHALYHDADSDGKISMGDTLTYTIEVDNKGLLPLGNVIVLDALPEQLEYIPDSTTWDGEPISDNDAPGASPFPLDEDGFVIPIILRGGTSVFTYKVKIVGTGQIINIAGNSQYDIKDDNEITVETPGGCTGSIRFTDAGGNTVNSYGTDSDIYLELVNPSSNTDPGVIDTVTVTVRNETGGDYEYVVLVETAADSGIFVSAALPASGTAGLAPNDGTLFVRTGDNLSVRYVDPVCFNPYTASVVVPVPSKHKPLYLQSDGDNEDGTGALNRINPVAAASQTLGKMELSSGVPMVEADPNAGIVLQGAASTHTFTDSSTTFSHNSGMDGDNRILLVGVSYYSTPYPTNVSYGGVAMTQIARVNNPTSGALGGVALYYLPNPSTGNNTVSITLSGTSNNNYTYTAGAVTYSGVDLNVAYENFAATAFGRSVAPAVQVPSGAGDLVFGVVGGVSSSAYTLGGSGGTLEWSDRSATGSNPMPGAGQSKPGDSPSVTLSWSGSSNSWGAVGISLKPVDPTKGYVVFNSSGSTSWTVPDGVTEVTVEAWGGGGGGGGRANSGNNRGAGGGGGGAFASDTIAVTPGQTISVSVGVGGTAGVASNTGSAGNGGTSSALYNSSTIVSAGGGSGGGNGDSGSAGNGGVATVGETSYSGGNGAAGAYSLSGGGGGSAGSGGVGTAANKTTGGDSSAQGGGKGADGLTSAGNGQPGGVPGGGGSGAYSDNRNSYAGGAGAPGQVVISYAINTTSAASFTQAPAFCSNFEMPQGGLLAATNYVEVAAGGSLPANPDISAELSIGETVFATLENPVATDLGDGIYALVWGGAVASNITVASGQAITWTLLNSSGAALSVLYGHEDYPSQVSLPTTTVISIDELAIYEEPYPATAAVGGAIAGETVYIRARVSDPFGAYDITGLELVDQNGSIAMLSDANVVDSGTCYKTYEYAWKPPREGQYEVTAIAHEGSEGIIDSLVTPFDVTTLDLGTPSITEFTDGPNGPRQDLYEPDATVCLRVTDLDQNHDPEVIETVTVTVFGADGDTLTVTLYETGADTGIFTACIESTSTINDPDDGKIYGPPGTIYEVHYQDPHDPTDKSSDDSRVPITAGTPGVRLTKTLIEPIGGKVLVGQPVVYSLRVINTGDTTLSTVSVTDIYPEELEFKGAEPAQSSHTSASHTLVWNNVGPLEPGQSKRIELAFEAVTAADEVVNSAIADAGDGLTSSDDAKLKITEPRHTIVKTLLSDTPAAYGAEVNYRIEVENTGNTRIATLPLEDTFSAAYLRYLSADRAPDGAGAGSLFWENIAPVGGLEPAGKVIIEVAFEVIGAADPVINTAKANYSVDEYGDSVPPVSDDAELTTSAGSISGHVINDLNMDGIKDSGEPGLPGVTVLLYADPEGNGEPVASNLVAVTTTSGADGFYEFPNLKPGKYIVVEVDPAGYASSGDSNDGEPDGNNDNRIHVEVEGAGDYENNDFFDYLIPVAEYSSIAGTVWDDENRNASNDPGEKGIPGVTVELYRDGRLVSETKTDSNGNYKFPALPPGNYTVVEKDPAGYESTGDVDGPNDNRIDVAIAEAGQDITGRDFYDAALPARLYGYTFVDNDESLTRTPADGKLAGVTVKLYKADGVTLVGETTTDANGYYEFDDIEPGDYEVRFFNETGDLIDVPSSGTAAASNPERNRAIAESGYDKAVVTIERGHGYGKNPGEPLNAGYSLPPEDPPVTIGSRVWLDENGDGIADAGEDGIPNVVVELVDGDNNVVATTITDENGNYLFTDIPAGEYSVRVDHTTLPPGLAAHPTYDEDGTGTAHTSQVPELEPGDDHRTANFGYNWRDPEDVAQGRGNGVIGDRIWIDANGDGVQDPGEPGMGGVTVTLLWDPNGTGVYDTPYTEGGYNPVTTTTPDGRYAFADLPPGSYVIEVNDGDSPEGYTPSGDPDYFGQALPDGVVGDNRTTHPIILAPGDVYVNADFGYQPEAGKTAQIGQRVWFDADANGSQNDGERGIPGVSVVLIQDNDGDGKWSPGEPIIATTITDEHGDYLFDGVPVGGNYLVWVNDTAGLLNDLWPTYDFDGGGNGYGLSAVGNLPAAGTTQHNFGYTAPGQTLETGLIGDTIFLDRDGDGQPGAGEGLEGVVVKLYKADGVTLVATTTTDANGNYYFGALKDGTYQVVVDTDTLPNGGAGLVNTIDPDTAGSGDSRSTVTIRGGGVNLDQDFGYAPATPNKIRGTVWEDRNADGTLGEDEAEGGLEGVTIELRDENGKVVAKTTTDANGDYEFTNIPDGTYYVKVTDEGGKLRGWWHKRGPNDGVDDNSQTQEGSGYEVTVGEGNRDDTTGDFGYHYQPAEIGNLVWEDINNDGIQDEGEPGIEGVPVTLTVTYPDGPVVTVVTVTDENGHYSFGNLLLDEDHTGRGAGQPTYEISVGAPEGWQAAKVGSGADPELDSDNHDGVLAAIEPGRRDDSYDFGFFELGNIHGYAFHDKVRDDVRKEGDDGVNKGMTVELWKDGKWVASTTTDENGYYEFTELPPGDDYEIRFGGDPGYVVDVPGEEGSDNPQRNRAVVEDDGGEGYVVIKNVTVASGGGTARRPSEPQNAGFKDKGPLSSAIELRAFQGEDGVYVELAAHDVSPDGVGFISIYLFNEAYDELIEWQRIFVEPGELRTLRFKFTALVVGGRYNFVVEDEEGFFWMVDDLEVTPFAMDMVSMSKAGVNLRFDTLPGNEYAIEWCARLGDQWQVVTNLTAVSTKTSVTVKYPDPESPTGFFRVKVK